MDLITLQREYDRAHARYWRLVDRYNREYRAGRWTTNRPLAGACENAYDVMVRAEIALREATGARSD